MNAAVWGLASLIVVVGICAGPCMMESATHTVSFTSQQPESQKYDHFPAYEVQVVSPSIFGHISSGLRVDEIRVGVFDPEISRFYSETVSVNSGLPTKADWTTKGLTVTYDSGQSVFIERGKIIDKR